MPYLTRGLTTCYLTCFCSFVTKVQFASADLGRSYFWHLDTRASVYIIKPCRQQNHKSNTVQENSTTLVPIFGPWGDSGPLTGSVSKASAGASQMTTAGWAWYYQWSSSPMATGGI